MRTTKRKNKEKVESVSKFFKLQAKSLVFDESLVERDSEKRELSEPVRDDTLRVPVSNCESVKVAKPVPYDFIKQMNNFDFDSLTSEQRAPMISMLSSLVEAEQRAATRPVYQDRAQAQNYRSNGQSASAQHRYQEFGRVNGPVNANALVLANDRVNEQQHRVNYRRNVGQFNGYQGNAYNYIQRTENRQSYASGNYYGENRNSVNQRLNHNGRDRGRGRDRHQVPYSINRQIMPTQPQSALNSRAAQNQHTATVASAVSDDNNNETIDYLKDKDVTVAQTIWWIHKDFPTKYFRKDQILAIQLLIHNLIILENGLSTSPIKLKHLDVCHIAIISGCAMITASSIQMREFLIKVWDSYMPRTWDGDIICNAVDHNTILDDLLSPIARSVRIFVVNNDTNQDNWKETIDECKAFPFDSKDLTVFENSEGITMINRKQYSTFDAILPKTKAEVLNSRIKNNFQEYHGIVNDTERTLRIQFAMFIEPSLCEISGEAMRQIAEIIKKPVNPRRRENKSKYMIMHQLQYAKYYCGMLTLNATHFKSANRKDSTMSEDDLEKTVINNSNSSGKSRNSRSGKKEA